MDHIKAWRVVRTEILSRLRAEIADAYEPSIFFADSIEAGDASEFADMLENVEFLLGVPEGERINWKARIREMEIDAGAAEDDAIHRRTSDSTSGAGPAASAD